MRSDLTEELADFRREVKAVLDVALSESDAPLAVGDLRRGGAPGRSAPLPRGGGGGGDATKSASCRVCSTVDGRVANDMGAVDRELALLEQSNAALFAALAQTRAMPVSRLPPALDARMRSIGAREEARDAARLREAAELQERERRRRHEKRQLVERTRDLKQTVSDLERQKMELNKKLEEKRKRREQREADSRRRKEKRKRDDEARALRQQMGSSAKEADRLRAKLRGHAQQTARARAREALWRWRARAAAAVAKRERKERLAAEQAMAASSSAAARDRGAADVNAGGAGQQVGLAGSAVEGDEGDRRYNNDRGAAAGSAATVLAPSAEYEGIYGGGSFGDGGYVSGQFGVGTIGAGSGDYSTSAALAASAAAAAAEAATQQQAAEAQNAAAQRATMGVERGNHQLRRRPVSTTPLTSAMEEVAFRRAGSRVSMGAAAATAAAAASAATTAATAAATAAAEADDAARRSWEAQEQQLQLSRLAAERSELERRVADAENTAVAAAAVGQATAARRFVGAEHSDVQHQQRAWQRQKLTHGALSGTAAISHTRHEHGDEQDDRPGGRATAPPERRAKALARSLALVLRASTRARDTRRVRRAFGAWRTAAASRSALKAREAAAAAGAKAVAGLTWRMERRALQRSFRLWARMFEGAKRKDLARQAALRHVARRAARRSREVEVAAFQRWRLATATAVVEKLRRQERAGSVGRGAVVAEAALRRRDAGRISAGFRRWREADAEMRQVEIAAARTRDRRTAAATATAGLLHRRRRNRLRRGLQALSAAARAKAERKRRAERDSLSVAMSQRAARTLLLTRCWGAWKALAAAGVLARRLDAAGVQAQRMRVESRRLRAEQLAWVCKAAMAASEMRRKAHAWRLWRQVQGRAKVGDAIKKRVLLAAAQRWRTARLRAGWRRWRAGCRAVRAERALVRSRAARLGSVAAFLGGGSGSLRKIPRMDVARAFGTWVRVAEARKVESLQRRQGARILLGVLRSSRRRVATRAIEAWRSAAAQRAENGQRVHRLVLRTAHRQRVFFLGKAWSRIVWAAGEREAARARQLGAARTVHCLLASSARASRRRAWLRWKNAVAGTAAAEALHGARRRILRQCLRSRLLRDTRAALEALQSRVLRSRAVVAATARLDGVLLRSRRRALSRGLGVWRSASLAEAIAAGRRRGIRDSRLTAARLLGSVGVRVRRRRLEDGWRALALRVADGRRAAAAEAARAEHAEVLARGAAQRLRRRMLAAAWRAWKELVAQRRLRGAVGAATSLLTEQTASLARQVELLRLGGAVRLMLSVAERSNRFLLLKGWWGLRQASRRRATLVRAVGIFSRARSQRLGFALNRWRSAATDERTAELRMRAAWSVLAACLSGARGRAMRPAWESWRELVEREREEEDEFAGREEGLLAFASVVTRVARRRDRDRRRRAFGAWRLGAARSAVTVAQQQVARGSEMVRAVEVENADLLAAQVDCRASGARLALLWFHRRRTRTQLAAWCRWTATVAEDRDAEQREERRGRAAAQLARELARVVDGRRHRILRGSLRLWRRHAEEHLAHAVAAGRDASCREAGARRLSAVLERNLLRRQARVWGRLVGATVAASGRLQRERDALEQRDHLLAVAESRSSRRLLSRSWLAWKALMAEQRHRGEVDRLRAASGAVVLATVERRKDDEALRRALSLWRKKSQQARQRERVLSRAVACLLRSEARGRRVRMAHYLGRWRVASLLGGRALAEEERASTELAFRGQAVVSIFMRTRAHRLSEGFRRLAHNRTVSVYGSREEQARRENVARGLHGLRRTMTRRWQRRVMRSFARWKCFAAEVGQQGDRALLANAQRRTGAQMVGSVMARHEAFIVAHAWTIWRSGAASAAIHDGERASADLRVSGARHSAGARLLATTISSARRRVLWSAWQTWCREAKASADAELRTMEMHFHLARTLTRVEKRADLAKVRRAWGAWSMYARSVSCLPRVAERSRRARLAQGMSRWRVASAERGKAKAEQERAVAEGAVRGRALWALLKRRSHRQVGEAFNRILQHGAWAIYRSREEDIRNDRLSQGFRVLARAGARRKERAKLAAMSRWRYFASDSRRQEERDVLQARGKRASAKTLASLVAHREKSRVGRAWALWRSGAASAAAHEGERASADLRVFGARRSAGCRLLVGVLGSARRGALAKAWSTWRKEVTAAADAELHTMEMHFHLARTLTRVERRTEVAKMARAWRAWGEVVRAEGEAELQALERHYHVAQTVARVVARAQERRLSRAWSLWARLAARGAAGRPAAASARRVSQSLSSLPPGLLAAARNPRDTASLARVSGANASWPVGAARGASTLGYATTAEREQQARRSRAVMYTAGATAVRGLFRRAEARSLSRAWQAWKGMTTADAAREARGILGATRIAELFVEAQENHKAQLLRRSWAMWAEWSTAEGGRLEQEAEAASWAVAEEKERSMKAAAAVEALAAVTGRWADRVLRARLSVWARTAKLTKGSKARGGGGGRWSPRTSPPGPASSAGMTTAAEDVRTPRGDARGAPNLGGVAPSSASPASAMSLLRSKLRGESSPGLPVLPARSLGSRNSPGDALPPSHRLTEYARVPIASAGGLATPTSPLAPLASTDANRNGPTPGSGRAWSDQFNYSSTPCSPSQRPAGAGDKTTSAANGRAHLETGALFPVGRMGGDLSDNSSSSSLDLTASAESVKSLRPRAAAGGTACPLPFGGANTNAAIGGSPEGSLAAYMSDSSPLLGESVLVSRGGTLDGRAMFGAGGVSIGNGGLVFVSKEVAKDGSASTAGVLQAAAAVHAPPGEREGRGSGVSFADKVSGGGATGRTPESRVSRLSPLSANTSGGRVGSYGRARFPQSPPYVSGSVGALSLGRGSPPRDGEEEGEEGHGDVDGGLAEGYSSNGRQRNQEAGEDEEREEEGVEGLAAGVRLEMSADSELPNAAEGPTLQSNVRLEQYEQEAPDVPFGMEFSVVGGEVARAAEDFVDIMTSVLWRRAFTRWAQVTRDAAFRQKEAETHLKLARLKLLQKLRKVVVSAIRRQNLTGRVNDAASAVRKWKQFVRRCREDERLSREVAAFSPMTPMGARLRAAPGGLGESFARSAERSGRREGGGVGVTGVRGYGIGGEGETTPSFYRSPTFPAAAERSCTRRRLWDQSSPQVSPVEMVDDT
eukprot:g14538.t1